jgi:hypothetical protein
MEGESEVGDGIGDGVEDGTDVGEGMDVAGGDGVVTGMRAGVCVGYEVCAIWV